MIKDPFRPAKRVAGNRQDVWTIVNEAASSVPAEKGVVNMGQGFFGYNPPDFVLDAARDAIGRVECNQYSPAKGRPRLKKAIAEAYSKSFGRKINPDTEIAITTGANEGMLSAFMGFLEQDDEVIVFEPFFDQYISNIEMPGGKVVYVPLHPPKDGATKKTSAGEWSLDIAELESAITPRTRMLVLNNPHNPIGKVFNKEELLAIGNICVKNNIIILSDEVYDSLYYVPFTRVATLSPEIEKLTLTVGSGGKNFFCTGWRIGWLIGPANLIQYVMAAHTRICFSSPSPLQEATAVAFEQADQHNFWDESRKTMKAKVDLFSKIFDELDLPYSEPEGGYFVMANLAKVKLPADYEFPPHVANRPRDFKMSWFLIKELGVAAIPPTEFLTDKNAHIVEDWLRFAVYACEVEISQSQDNMPTQEHDDSVLDLGDKLGDLNTEVNARTDDEYAQAQLTIRAIVTSKEAGIIIGKAGQNVAELRDKTGVRAGVSKVVPGVHDRVLTITGSLRNISEAYGLVADGLLKGAPQMGMGGIQMGSNTHPIRLLVSHNQMGTIIGRQGAKIKQIQDGSGVRMVAQKEMLPQSTERIVEVQGGPEGVSKAVWEIGKCLVDDEQRGFGTVLYSPAVRVQGAPLSNGTLPPRSFNRTGNGADFAPPPGTGNTSGPPPRRFDDRPPPPAAADGEEIQTQNISIPADMVGCIIGRGGSKISEIRKSSGARISIAKAPHDESGERMFTITGGPSANEKALYLLYENLEAEKMRRSENADSA